jgi:glycosyltransferase involved in cell wall biosynthesis
METGIIKVAERIPDDFRISLCILADSEDFSKRLGRPDIRVHMLPDRKAGIDWSWIPRLVRLFRSEQVDIVHSHGWGTLMFCVVAAKLARVPIVHSEHGYNMKDLRPEPAIRRRLKHFFGQAVDELLTVSEELRERWITQYGIPAGRVRHIPNGVDTERFRPMAGGEDCYRHSFGLPKDAWVVGSVGRLVPIKNYPALLQAAAALRPGIHNLVVALLGVGAMEEHLRSLAADLGISDRVFFLGFREDVPDFLHTLDVFVLPSFNEGMSNVLIEAMASGVPVVASAIPPNRELIESGRHGLLLDPCNVETLSAAIEKLRTDSDLRTSMVAHARIRVCERYSVENWVGAHTRLYSRIVPHDQPRAGFGIS